MEKNNNGDKTFVRVTNKMIYQKIEEYSDMIKNNKEKIKRNLIHIEIQYSVILLIIAYVILGK